MKNLFIAASFIIIFVTLCCSPAILKEPKSYMLEGLHYGAEPDTTQMIKQVAAYFSDVLFDFDSAKFKSPIIKRGWFKDKNLIIKGGYIYTIGVNAKNTYGAYAGWQVQSFIFRDNMIYVFNPNPWHENKSWGFSK